MLVLVLASRCWCLVAIDRSADIADVVLVLAQRMLGAGAAAQRCDRYVDGLVVLAGNLKRCGGGPGTEKKAKTILFGR